MRIVREEFATATVEEIKAALAERQAALRKERQLVARNAYLKGLKVRVKELVKRGNALNREEDRVHKRMLLKVFVNGEEYGHSYDAPVDENVREKIKVTLKEFAKSRDIAAFPPGRVHEYAREFARFLTERETQRLAAQADKLDQEKDRLNDEVFAIESNVWNLEGEVNQLKNLLQVPYEERMKTATKKQRYERRDAIGRDAVFAALLKVMK